MSVSDLMTGLMVIFLFIAIAYMSLVRKNQSVLTDYVETKQKLHDKLVNEFKADTVKWQMAIGKDLSMKFKNPTVLFAQGKADLTPAFQKILDDFIPRYLNILITDSLRSRINEIRIEGHTDNVPFPALDADPYLANIILSQQRALNVLRYIRNMPSFQRYTQEQKQMLEFWFTSNGLSYGKALDMNGEYIYESKKKIDLAMSRRVEFRIVTSGDEIFENFVNKNKE
ncbi:MAG: OmpA family protein [Bacteroides sp.]|nr:OmpA family protein [Bacteroides sp.]